jgi:hypothetical protein
MVRERYNRKVVYTMASYGKQKRYGIGRFIFDVFMTCITGGLWLLWLLFKFFRTNS